MRCPWFLLFVALGGWGCGGSEPAEPAGAADDGTVTLTEAQRETAAIGVEQVMNEAVHVPVVVPAQINAPDTALAALGSIVEGRVEEVRVVPGDRVAAGDALIYIHSHELAEAIRDLESAQADQAYRQAAYDRSLRLLEAGAVSREEVERRRAELDAARAERVRAREMVDHLDPSPSGDVTVRSPRDGTVLAVHVGPSAAVVPGEPLVEVGSVRTLWATAYIPEEQAASLTPGGDARVSFRALPSDTVPGRLVRLGARVDPSTRTLEVRVEVPEPPRGARPGMYATVELLGAGEIQGVVLPADAVQRFEEADVVFVEEAPGVYRPHPVTVVPMGAAALLARGIPDGSRVVVMGAYFVRSAAEQGGLAEDEG